MHAETPPDDFVLLNQFCPEIRIDLKYFSGDNFVGGRIDGYYANACWLTRHAAQALAKVQQTLTESGLGLLIFDGYRPTRSVEHFIRWSSDQGEQPTRAEYFPAMDKSELFNRGYLARNSSHSRGSTADLTLVDLASGEPLDMGTRFDFFGQTSWINTTAVSAQALANRLLLRTIMEQHGFVPFQQEWWHFTLADEPYPERYFDFPVVESDEQNRG